MLDYSLGYGIFMGSRNQNHTTMHPLVEKAIAKYPKARKIAVENFTYGNEGKGMNFELAMNLGADTRCYAWKPDTVKAIKFVINGK